MLEDVLFIVRKTALFIFEKHPHILDYPDIFQQIPQFHDILFGKGSFIISSFSSCPFAQINPNAHFRYQIIVPLPAKCQHFSSESQINSCFVPDVSRQFIHHLIMFMHKLQIEQKRITFYFSLSMQFSCCFYFLVCELANIEVFIWRSEFLQLDGPLPL